MYKMSDGRHIPSICVTNRLICDGDFYERMEEIAFGNKADAILLREKDLTEEEYADVAKRVMIICQCAGIPCVIHTHWKLAHSMGCRRIHMPLGCLEEMTDSQKKKFEQIGSSVHSVEQAKRAVELGANVLIAGHVFETDCKKGLPGRGTEFVRTITQAVDVPVYGIGGICRNNAQEVVLAGAVGVCGMSSYMNPRY